MARLLARAFSCRTSRTLSRLARRPVWVDLIADDAVIPSIDVSSGKPHEIVIYEVQGGRYVTLQLSGATAAKMYEAR